MKHDVIVKILEEKQAESITGYNVEGRCDYADYLLIASAKNSVHLNTLVTELTKAIKQHGNELPKLSGQKDSGWVILVASEAVVHILLPDTRRFYDLDHLISTYSNQIDHF